MKKIGLLSDTHGHLEEGIFSHFSDCDEIWHAGDLGDGVADTLEGFKPFRAVYGNIDSHDMRLAYPEDLVFECEGMRVWMTHIGAVPPHYNKRVKARLNAWLPGLFICGHSHILRVVGDPARRLYYVNPGAAGKHGFHKVKTIMTFCIHQGKLSDMKVIELGARGTITQEH